MAVVNPEALAKAYKRPSWLSWMNVVSGVNVLVLLCGLIFWVATESAKTDNTALAMGSVNARLDRLFDKLDTMNVILPVIQEKISQLENHGVEERGTYASLRDRLSAIEANSAANHIDASRALGKKP
jgi:hypothetical protein